MDELIQGLQGPRTAQQELFYDLEDAAAVLGWAVVELAAFAQRGTANSEAAALAKVCALLSEQQKKIGSYSSEVKNRRIVRSEEL